MAIFPLELSLLTEIVHGECLGECPPIERVVIDTRVPLRSRDVYVAIKGERFDGGDFVEHAWQQGVRCVVLSKEHPLATQEPPKGCALIRVEDGLTALQDLAAYARAQFHGPVVAITGSNGKTTVKEMLRAALGDALQVFASPLSWNSQVGVAMTLLQLDLNADVALIECGISKPGEMQRLERMVRPTHGIFVNVGDAHRETLHDAARTAKEKAILFKDLDGDQVWTPSTEHHALRALQDLGILPQRVGAAPDAEFAVQWSADGRTLQIGTQQLSMPDVPAGLRKDAELSVAIARALGADWASIARGFSGWAPAPMRLEMTRTPRGVFILNDAYSADPESFDVALRSLQSMRHEGRAIAVVGPLAQLGRARASAHARVGRAVAEAAIDQLILVGEAARDIGEAAAHAGLDPDRIAVVERVADAAMLLDDTVQRGDRVLIKASRPERLERVAELLFSSFGPAIAHIDLERLAQNLQTVRQLVGPEVGVMPVVKSFGYGLDSVRLGRLYVQRGADALAVAYADEGVVLREQGISVPILVQNILPHEVHKVVAHDLSAEVVDIEIVQLLQEVAQKYGKTVRVHIKVDTGMGRCGMLPDDALNTVRAALQSPALEIEGLMTHLASSDDVDTTFTEAQLERFERFVQQARAAGATPRWVHAANTAAAVRFAHARYDLIRSGIGLLGYADLPDGNPFVPVLRLTTRVVAVKFLPEGAPVGYGSTWHVPKGGGARRIAVVAIGYNDGYPRHLSNRGWMEVSGQRCPVVGRVCMDVTMIDVTDVSVPVEKGDLVTVYGHGPTEPALQDMAERADTIAYELLTRISPRVRRIFVGEISGQSAS